MSAHHQPDHRVAHSIFHGDPIVIDDISGSELGGDPIQAPSSVTATLPSIKAAIKGKDDADAVARVAAVTKMSPYDKNIATRLMPLILNNATILVQQVSKPLLASNLNYNLQQALNDYPNVGKIFTGAYVAPSGSVPAKLTVTISSTEVTAGYLPIPFLKFNLSQSNLNARAGGQYTLQFSAVTKNNDIVASAEYEFSFQRQDVTKPITGIFIPFRVLATRTLPVLALAGGGFSGSGDDLTFSFSILGVSENAEVLTVTVPGYATHELKEMATALNLPAGLI
jgi:hypothetical protein